MVGTVGFEPTTPCTPCRCATRLRHAPTVVLTVWDSPEPDWVNDGVYISKTRPAWVDRVLPNIVFI